VGRTTTTLCGGGPSPAPLERGMVILLSSGERYSQGLEACGVGLTYMCVTEARSMLEVYIRVASAGTCAESRGFSARGLQCFYSCAQMPAGYCMRHDCPLSHTSSYYCSLSVHVTTTIGMNVHDSLLQGPSTSLKVYLQSVSYDIHGKHRSSLCHTHSSHSTS
jgi:hypothetical protein